jgi:hypothetical protein
MSSPEEILVGNLVEALQQLQRFMVVGLGTSISALALTGGRATRKQRYKVTAPGSSVAVDQRSDVTVPGTFVAVDPELARLLLLALCFVSGVMANYSADAVSLLYGKLSAEMQVAACTFPSLATSKYVGVRILAAILPFVFAMIAVWRVVRSYSLALQDIGGWAIVLGAAYLPLTLQLWAAQCLAR